VDCRTCCAVAVAGTDRARRDLNTVRSPKSTCKRIESVVDLLAGDSIDRFGSLTDRLRE